MSSIGYELLEYDNYYRKYEKDYQVQINIFDRKILVFKKRKNSNWGDYIGYSGEEEKIKKYIQDLIKANLLVKEQIRSKTLIGIMQQIDSAYKEYNRTYCEHRGKGCKDYLTKRIDILREELLNLKKSL